PVVGAGAYLLQYVFDYWSDKFYVHAFKHLVSELKKGVRVVVLNYIMPEPGTLVLL
ncbi:hypothetical protein K505DRAFT_230779, partial [Melanomma pulvis-pyrius CBS 109.77]